MRQRQLIRILARSLMALLSIGALLWAFPAIATPPSLTVAQARQQPPGCVVTVTGTVTVPSGEFAATTQDAGFALQDATAGIYVSTDQDLGLAVGDRGQATGKLQDDGHGLLTLQLQRWQALTAAAPAAKAVSPGDITEKTEGVLVTVTGTITTPITPDPPYGDRLRLRDETGEVQIYVPRSTAIPLQTMPFLQPGQRLQVTGMGGQYDQTYEVMPRFPEDLQPLPAP